jgi:sarcosine oxidase subunit alpha
MTGKPYRLPQGSDSGRIIDRSKPLSFTFDGKKMSGFAGDTLASAVMANGRRVLGRSFKYHRPRGLITLGSEEPNGLVGVGCGSRFEPDLRATQVELYDGMTAVSQNRWPSLDFDVGIVNNTMSRLFPSGFYYKTFMWPKSFWHKVYEPIVRHAAGLGVAPEGVDPDIYEQVHVHCDVLVVGAGVAGLAAAEAVAASGARVIICDENPRFGGNADLSDEQIEGKSQLEWVREKASLLTEAENVHAMTRATVIGHYHHNYLMVLEKVADHDPSLAADGTPRHRLWKVRAQKVILASGANERPMTFANNDRPGVMLSTAARGLVDRYGVAPGLIGLIYTNNDDAYHTALHLKKAGVAVGRIVDVRENAESDVIKAVHDAGIEVMTGCAIAGVETSSGGKQLQSVKVAPYTSGGGRVVDETAVTADFVAVSGGWNPAVHLWCHNGGKLRFDEEQACFRPLSHSDEIQIIGSANGTMDLAGCLTEGYAAGEKAGGKKISIPKTVPAKSARLQPIWFAPATGKYNEGNKHFIDLQNDVTAADLELAQREGYVSVEHTKRYTTLGMATDQGKTSNVNALGVISQATGRKIPEIGTTTFRPPYTAISFGSIAGSQRGKLFHVIRRTSVYDWHIAQTKVMEPVGDWRRAYCYPKTGESQQDAINREIMVVREKVGVLDASTLGKIEIKGPDAGKLLDLVYTNMFSTLKTGKCRYGLMMNEMGFLMDDGVTVKLDDDHYLMHTTSGGSDRIAAWLEEWLQTEWPDLKVYVTPVTEQWAQFAIAGPQARKVLEKLGTELDLSNEAMPFMSMASGEIGGFPVRLFRISFSGELSFEIATPANFGQDLWDRILEAGAAFGIEPYGTEALHVLRAEKGFVVIGDETDGTVTPHDVGMSWAVSKKKADYIGKRSLEQEFLKGPDRKQLVGLATIDPKEVLPNGAQAVEVVKDQPPMTMIGHVTSSYWSPTLERSIAMALIKNGRNRMGERISFPLEGKVVEAEIVDPVFYDKEGARQNV